MPSSNQEEHYNAPIQKPQEEEEEEEAKKETKVAYRRSVVEKGGEKVDQCTVIVHLL